MEEWRFEPAHDFGLSAEQRRLSLRREVGLESAISCFLWRSITRVYLATAHRLKICGRARRLSWWRTTPVISMPSFSAQFCPYDLSARFSRSRPATHFLRNGLRQFSRLRS